MGTEKAAVAVAHEILAAASRMLRRAVGSADLGADHLDRIDTHGSSVRAWGS